MVDFKSYLIAVVGNGTFGIPYVGEESFVTFFCHCGMVFELHPVPVYRLTFLDEY